MVRLGVGGLVTCKNAIEFDHNGGRRHHTVAMGPHSRQQIIQQSTNMLCGRSTSLKLEKNVFITSDNTINARRVDDDNARTITSLASLPPLTTTTTTTLTGVWSPSPPATGASSSRPSSSASALRLSHLFIRRRHRLLPSHLCLAASLASSHVCGDDDDQGS